MKISLFFPARSRISFRFCDFFHPFQYLPPNVCAVPSGRERKDIRRRCYRRLEQILFFYDTGSAYTSFPSYRRSPRMGLGKQIAEGNGKSMKEVGGEQQPVRLSNEV